MSKETKTAELLTAYFNSQEHITIAQMQAPAHCHDVPSQTLNVVDQAAKPFATKNDSRLAL